MRYVIDAKASRLTVRVFAGGMLSSVAHNPTFAARDFSGEVEFDPASPASASLKLRVRAESIELTDEFSSRDRWDIMHMMQDDILDVAGYPEIGYECPAGRATLKPAGGGHFEASLRGDLTIHGTTRPSPVTGRLLAGPDNLRASGELTIRQTEFNLKPVTAAGSMIKVKDEVKLTFDLVAHK